MHQSLIAMALQSWTKLLRKLRTWGHFFLTSQPTDSSLPPPPGSSVVSKESRNPKHLQEATLNWGREFSLRKAVDLEIVLLRQVVHINENIFSSSFVQDCSLLTIPHDQLLPPSDEKQQSKRRSFMCPYRSSFVGHSFNLLWISHQGNNNNYKSKL